MRRSLCAVICIILLISNDVPSLYAQDEELGEEDLMIQHDLGGLRPAAEKVEKSGAERFIGDMPLDTVVKLTEGDGKKESVVLVGGHMISQSEEALGQSELLQRKVVEGRVTSAGSKEGAYVITGEMSGRKKEALPNQNKPKQF